MKDKLGKEAFKYYLYKKVHRTEWGMATVIMVMQFFMMLLFALKEGGPFYDVRTSHYFMMYIILFVITAIALVLYLITYRQKNLRGIGIVRVGYSVIICLWASVLTYLGQLGNSDLTVFSYTIVALAAVLVMSKRWSIPLLILNYIFVNILLMTVPGAAGKFFGNILNTTFVTVLAGFISIRIYQGNVKEYRDFQLIEEQYEKIQVVNEQLNEKAVKDVLTGLYNRRFLEEDLGEKFRQENGTTAVIMIDVDYFKSYNDYYGHQKGDECLAAVAGKIGLYMDERSLFGVRYGGEEFCICGFGYGMEKMKKTAMDIRSSILQMAYPRKDSRKKMVTVSMGVGYQEEGEAISLKEIIKRADEALYEAKETGRNRIVVQRMEETGKTK